MNENFARQLGLLRKTVENLVSKQPPDGPITSEYLRVEGLALVRRHENSLLAVRRPGYEAYRDFTESLIQLIPGIERGIAFATFEAALLEFLVACNIHL